MTRTSRHSICMLAFQVDEGWYCHPPFKGVISCIVHLLLIITGSYVLSKTTLTSETPSQIVLRACSRGSETFSRELRSLWLLIDQYE